MAEYPKWFGELSRLSPSLFDCLFPLLANLRTPGFGKLLLLGPQQGTLGLQLVEIATRAYMADQ